MSFSQSRRHFIKSLSLIPAAFVLGSTRWITTAFAAAKKTVTATVEQAKAALVDVKKADTPKAGIADTMAKALKYMHKSGDPSKVCSNCMQYTAAVDAKGKDIQIDVPGAGMQAVGTCALFNAGKGYVSASGYCLSWFKMPA